LWVEDSSFLGGVTVVLSEWFVGWGFKFFGRWHFCVEWVVCGQRIQVVWEVTLLCWVSGLWAEDSSFLGDDTVVLSEWFVGRGFKLSGRWHCCVEWVVRGISKELVAFKFFDCLPLNVKMTWYYKTSETTHPVTQHHIPGHLNPWVKICASRTSKTVLYWFVAKKVLHLPNKTTWIQGFE